MSCTRTEAEHHGRWVSGGVSELEQMENGADRTRIGIASFSNSFTCLEYSRMNVERIPSVVQCKQRLSTMSGSVSDHYSRPHRQCDDWVIWQLDESFTCIDSCWGQLVKWAAASHSSKELGLDDSDAPWAPTDNHLPTLVPYEKDTIS